ncbi:uncharacterized protein STEHIDRAFT_171317 [Stereum hirsutum FP-91666 SS1]|uniref:uncharacterized protein n=1 Tax=Stereum hirsutum (strain FP-91666) TaxID=721885 RepID=UPI0004449968|nr:uncharacterized protein STEHIDRAFT_171317 [Stereum hirsutum FP-91666 SS1]EIM82373.1 hypothetical protein STEHIDRAFT_171317 [Stereum hirsutum FP-91666 SS1]
MSYPKVVSSSSLSTLSLDIIHEILCHLTPDDLLRVSWVSKSFHQLLTSRQTAWIWRRTWANVGDRSDIAPPLPEDISELAWTVLVFGGPGCQMCDSEDYQEIDWALRIRACPPCTTKSVTFSVPKSTIGVMRFMPLLQVLPRSMFRPRHHRSMLWPKEVSPYFLKRDAVRLAEEVDAVAAGLESEELTAKLEELRKAKALAYDKVLKHAKACVYWTERVEREQDRVDKMREAEKAERRQEITQRLLSLGYTHRQIASSKIWARQEFTSKAPWPDNLWTTIEPELVTTLEAEEADRIERKRQAALRHREEVLESQYRSLLLHKPPRSLALYPQPHELREISFRIASICDIPTLPEEEEDFSAEVRNVILQMFPASIKHWAGERKSKIMSTLVPPSSAGPLAIACGTFDVPFELTLAKNVYTAEANPETPLFGAEIFAYRHNGHELDEPSSSSSLSALNIPRLNKAAQRAVLALLELCGLDGATTTTQQLDHLHDRFVCEACDVQDAKLQTEELRGSIGFLDFDFTGRRARHWRDALDHQLRILPGHDFPRFTRITDERDQGPSIVELLAGVHYCEHLWGCGHCTVHISQGEGGFGSWMERAQVIRHLRDSHGLGTREPVDGLDIYYNPSFPKSEMIRGL